LGHLFANADLLFFHRFKALNHLSERERERALRSRFKNIKQIAIKSAWGRDL
jgi:hypothetical protein